MTDPTPGDFKIYDGLGNLIAHGRTPAEAFAPLPDSAVRAEAEQLLNQAAEAAGLIEAQQEQEEQLQQRQLRTFTDGISRLSARLDTFEKARALSQARDEARARERDSQRVAAMLDALPDPDAPSPEPYPIDLNERLAEQEGHGSRELPMHDAGFDPEGPGAAPAPDPHPGPAPGLSRISVTPASCSTSQH